jgi:hypothetical protein
VWPQAPGLLPFPFPIPLARVPSTYSSGAAIRIGEVHRQAEALGGVPGLHFMLSQHAAMPQAGPMAQGGGGGGIQGGGIQGQAQGRHACSRCGHLKITPWHGYHGKRGKAGQGERCTLPIPEGVIVPPATRKTGGKCRYPGCTVCVNYIG